MLAACLDDAFAGSGFQKVETDPKERAGALTLTGLLSHLAVDNRTSPVARGKFVRERLLCTHIVDPPEGIDISLPELPPGLTAREELEERTKAPVCATCHGLMNPIGFAFDKLDSIGRNRDEDNGLPLDVTGELTETDIDGSFEGVVELAHRLATSAQVRQCVAVQAFRHGVGRAEGAADACTVWATIVSYRRQRRQPRKRSPEASRFPVD